MLNTRRFLGKLALFATFAVAAGTILSGEARAQAPNYVGTFAMTNIGTGMCATGPGWNQGSVAPAPWGAQTSQEWAFLLLPNKYYAIYNVKTGLFLGQSFFTTTSVWTGDLSQQWYLYPFGNNVYAIVNAESRNVMTDPAAGGGTPNGPPLANMIWIAKPNQLWYLYFLYK